MLVLQETGALRRSIPIFIGEPEAVAIECAVRGVPAPRPLTHDLLKDVITELGATVSKVVITELRDATFYAEIHIDADGSTTVVVGAPERRRRARPAHREPALRRRRAHGGGGQLDRASDEDEEPEEVDGDVDELAEQFRDFLDTVHPEDFQQ